VSTGVCLRGVRLSECISVEKTHFSKKYDLKNFMEAEFARRNLFKQVAKESKQ